MAKLIKRLVGVLAFVLILLVVAVVSLPFIIDPNAFKPEIQALAAKQGVDLSLGGPISWQFYPTLGLSLSDLSVAPLTEPEQKLAQLQQVTAAVALMPLLKRQIRVEKLLVDGAAINLVVNNQGQGNWQTITATSESAPAPKTAIKTPTENTSPPTTVNTDNTDNATNSNLDVTINSIQLSQASLIYDDQQSGQRTELQDFDLRINDVNLDQRAFPLSLVVTVVNNAFAQPLTIKLNSQLKLNNALNSFDLNDGVLSLTNAGVALTFSAHADTDPSVQFRGDIDADINNSTALFKLLNIEKPLMADPAALSKIQFATTFNGSDAKLNLQKMTLVLDDTTITGNADVEFPSEQTLLALNLKLTGDRLDVDRYLPPPSEEPVATTTAAASPDSPLPLESLRGLNATVQANFEELIANKMPITQLEFAMQGRQGLWQLQKFNANFYQGKLTSSGEFDARPAQATMKYTATMADLALKPLLIDVADIDVLSGTIAMTVNTTTHAATTNQLMDNLNATANFTGNNLLASGFNVEQSYCQMVKQLKSEDRTAILDQSAEKNWPKETAINSVDGQFVFTNNQLDVKKLQAQIGNLVLAAKANANLNEQQYQVSLPLRLTNEKTSATGCQVNSKFLLDREVDVVGCKGSLAPMDFAKQCGLRSGAVTDLAKQALRYNFEKQGGNEKVEEAEKKIDQKKQDAREKAKEKLNDLLKR